MVVLKVQCTEGNKGGLVSIVVNKIFPFLCVGQSDLFLGHFHNNGMINRSLIPSPLRARGVGGVFLRLITTHGNGLNPPHQGPISFPKTLQY